MLPYTSSDVATIVQIFALLSGKLLQENNFLMNGKQSFLGNLPYNFKQNVWLSVILRGHFSDQIEMISKPLYTNMYNVTMLVIAFYTFCL